MADRPTRIGFSSSHFEHLGEETKTTDPSLIAATNGPN
jgi:hypothetical protein